MELPKIYATSTSKEKIDLTLSVNPLGCSPRVMKAVMRLTMKDMSSYPTTAGLIQLLARRFRVKSTDLLLGNGSEQLIKLIAQTFLSPGDLTVIENGSFGLFTKEALLAKGAVIFQSLEEMKKTNARLIFIANPKTPTGECIPQKRIKQIIIDNPKTIIVIDEANGELIDETSIPLSLTTNRVLVLKTLSKTFGLAGVRVGCAVGRKTLLQPLRDAQQPFPVSQLAVKLAEAALSDSAFIEKSKRFIIKERTFLTKQLQKRNISVANSVTNNLFIRVENTQAVVDALADTGVSVINGTFFPNMKFAGFRISLKDRKTNRLFLQKLDQVLACTDSKKLLPSKEVL